MLVKNSARICRELKFCGEDFKKKSVGKANAEDASTYRRLRRRRRTTAPTPRTQAPPLAPACYLVDWLSMAPQIAESPSLAGRGHSTRRVAAVLRKGQAALVLSLNSAFWGWSRVRGRGEHRWPPPRTPAPPRLRRGREHRRASACAGAAAARRPRACSFDSAWASKIGI